MPVIFLLLFRCLALYRLLYYVHRKDSEVSRACTWVVPLTVCWILTVKCSSELLFVPFFWRRHVLHMIELMHFPGGCNYSLSELMIEWIDSTCWIKSSWASPSTNHMLFLPICNNFFICAPRFIMSRLWCHKQNDITGIKSRFFSWPSDLIWVQA